MLPTSGIGGLERPQHILQHSASFDFRSHLFSTLHPHKTGLLHVLQQGHGKLYRGEETKGPSGKAGDGAGGIGKLHGPNLRRCAGQLCRDDGFVSAMSAGQSAQVEGMQWTERFA